jgi:hypothetical protein
MPKFRVAVDARPVIEVDAKDEEEAVARATEAMYSAQPSSMFVGALQSVRIVDWYAISEPTTVADSTTSERR